MSFTNSAFVIRDISVCGAPRRDIGVADGRVSDPASIRGAIDIDGSRLTAMPGLIDHHIHILATAAARSSVRLDGLVEEPTVIAAVRAGAQTSPAAGVRAIGYDERAAGLPDAAMLERWLPGRELRVQDRTGALWILSPPLMARLGSGPFPSCVELDPAGLPTGRIWRGDAWLRGRLGTDLPDVAQLGRDLLAFGVVGVTDASPANGPAEAALFSRLVREGVWPLRTQLMGGEDLPLSSPVGRGPLKLHYDERDLPPLACLAERIAGARGQGRAVAAHCVTEAELAWFLAALDEAGGARTGDRIEHGAVMSPALLAQVAASPLSVVSNPGFLYARGDRYAETIARDEQPSLHRLRSIALSGVPMAIGSDAPYGPLDPWLAIRAARDRRTAMGRVLGAAESLSVARTLRGYWRSFDLGVIRDLRCGSRADICLMRGSWADILREPVAERLVATFVAGQLRFGRGDLSVG